MQNRGTSDPVRKIETWSQRDLKEGEDNQRWLWEQNWKKYDRSRPTNWDCRKSNWIKYNIWTNTLVHIVDSNLLGLRL